MGMENFKPLTYFFERALAHSASVCQLLFYLHFPAVSFQPPFMVPQRRSQVISLPSLTLNSVPSS